MNKLINKLKFLLYFLLFNFFIFFSFFNFFIVSAYADFTNFQDNLNYANSIRGQVQEKGSSFDPASVFGQNYNPNPAQSKYFSDASKSSDNGLKSDAINNVNNNTTGASINNASKTRPIYHVDSASDAMQKSQLVQNDSYNISHGISDKYVDCKAASQCQTIYTSSSCKEAARYVTRNCIKYPKVTIIDQPYTETQTYSGNIAPKDYFSGDFYLPVSGTITSFDIQLKGSADDTWRCKHTYSAYLNGAYISSQYSGCGEGLGDMSYHNHNMSVPTTSGAPITFNFTGGPAYGYWAWAKYNLTIQAVLHRKVPQIDWITTCEGNLSGGICTDQSSACSIPSKTQYFDGVPVTLDCWNYNIVQQCGAPSDNNCQALRIKGCLQTNASCRTMLGDTCVVQNETYNCPEKKCGAADGIICGGDFFCMNGDCSRHNQIQNQNFGKDASELASISSAALDVQKQNSQDPHIFTGEAKECSIDLLGVKDCCKDTGWLNGLILNCSDEEKQLGIAKEKGLTVPAGDNGNEYCHNEVAGVCTAKHKVYCVFQGKLARIVQKQGRHDQLGISFGHVDDDSAHPDCRGLTVDELQKIDFSKIDFSEVIEDIKNNINLPNNNTTQQNVQQDIQKFYDQHKAHN